MNREEIILLISCLCIESRRWFERQEIRWEWGRLEPPMPCKANLLSAVLDALFRLTDERQA